MILRYSWCDEQEPFEFEPDEREEMYAIAEILDCDDARTVVQVLESIPLAAYKLIEEDCEEPLKKRFDAEAYEAYKESIGTRFYMP